MKMPGQKGGLLAHGGRPFRPSGRGRQALALSELFDADATRAAPDHADAAGLTTARYIRHVRWWERESPKIRVAEPPSLMRPLPGFRLFGIVGTWMEEDVIGASVANAFHQGCEKVFLVDNCSSDQTVENAVSSGATLACSYRTESYDEPLRISLMNATMQKVTEREGAAHNWWLWFDADEFPHGPEGEPLKHYLASLDARYRVVGARYLNHFPAGPPHYLPPYHPVHFQPLCYEHRQGTCGHRKHPLVRIDRDRPPVLMYEGFHYCDAQEVLLEPPSSAFIHHFPFRAPEVTYRRMTSLCEADGTGISRIQRQDRHEIVCYGAPSNSSSRFALLDAVYATDWNIVIEKISLRVSEGVILQAWADAFDGREIDVWYSAAELLEATQRWHARCATLGEAKGDMR